MQKAPVIERPDQDEQGRRGHDSENGTKRLATIANEQRQNDSGIDRDSTQQGNRFEMYFSGARQIHHADAERQSPYRHGDRQRSDESNRERE